MNNIPKIFLGSSKELITKAKQLLDTETDDLQTLLTKKDLLIIEKPKAKAQIGVEEVARLISFSYQKPILGKQAFAIIMDAQTLNMQAQNKLLKILESPPGYLHIVLLYKNKGGAPEKILQTVQSRCEIINLSRRENYAKGGEEESSNQMQKYASNFRENYLEFRELVDKCKDNHEKHELISQLIEEVIKRLSSESELSLVNRLNEIEQANRRNANPKLLVDNLYLTLTS
ncbi:MAG: hypothetical protein ACOCXP_03325 [Candidatus Dojkabacteria bacterium]